MDVHTLGGLVERVDPRQLGKSVMIEVVRINNPVSFWWLTLAMMVLVGQAWSAERSGGGGRLQTLGFRLPAESQIPYVKPRNDGMFTIEGFPGLVDAEIPKDPKSILALLTETAASVEYYKATKLSENNVKLEAIVDGSQSSGDTSLVAVHAFSMYRPIHIDGVTYAFGIKTYIRADYRVRDRKRKGTALLGLISIGAGVTSNLTEGEIRLGVSGMSGKPIPTYLNMPARLSEETITKALEDFAVIKSKIYDAEVNISPTIIGVLRSEQVQ